MRAERGKVRDHKAEWESQNGQGSIIEGTVALVFYYRYKTVRFSALFFSPGIQQDLHVLTLYGAMNSGKLALIFKHIIILRYSISQDKPAFSN